MALTFQNFKKEIDSTILTRGRDYYRRGHITDLTFDEEDFVWEAQVEGTEVYEVRVEQASNGTLTCSCTCPYDYGDVCKHVAAVMYAIEADYSEYLDGAKQKAAKKKKAPSRRDKLRGTLEQIGQKELIDILMEFAAADKKFFNQLELRVGMTGDSIEDYSRIVKDALKVGRESDGYYSYYGTTKAARQIQKLIDQAGDLAEKGELGRAVAFYQAIFEQVAAVFESADDSNGEFSDCLSTAVEGLQELAERLLPERRRELLIWLLTKGNDNNIRGLDVQWELFDAAANTVKTPEEQKILFDGLDSAFPKLPGEIYKSRVDYIDRYAEEHVLQIKHDVIQRLQGDSAAEIFLQDYEHLDRFRKQKIERFLKSGNLEAVVRLSKQGIAESEKQRLPGLTADYQVYLLAVAQRQGNTVEIARFARLLLQSNRGSFDDYFDLIKQHTPTAEWEATLQSLLKEISPWSVPRVLEREGKWEAILELVKRPGFDPMNLLAVYQNQLETHFPAEMIRLYEAQIETLTRTTQRDAYSAIVEYLRRIGQLGEEEKMLEIAESLKARFPKRRALLEELGHL